MVDDQFGVRMLYAGKTGTDNHTWFLSSSGDNLDEDASISRGSDAEGTYYTFNGDQIRANARTRLGYHSGDINDNHDEIDLNEDEGSGHMQEGDFKGGWRDVEITGYFMGTRTGSDEDMEIVLYCRGGRHDSRACEGFAYKGVLNYNNGEVRVRKEQWHPSGYTSTNWANGLGSGVRNKWVGMKFICVNRGAKPNISVYMELWFDRNNNNNWERLFTYSDTGQSWPSGAMEGDHCSHERNKVGTWSGPNATFRWDISGVRFKKLSVREIKEEGDFTPPPPGGGDPPPPPGGEDSFHRLVYPSEAITASGDNGNVVANINDQSTLTVWTHETLPAWAHIDMGARRTVGYVRINFTRGSERTVGFNIELSEDNQTWTTIFTGSSSGTTEDFERFDFVDTNARFVRLNITSNSQKNTASIREFEVWGLNAAIGEEPPPGPEPPGQDPLFLYIRRKHTFNVNYEVEDACNPPGIE